MYDIDNDYPLAQEKINIQKEWLSNYCLKIANELNITIGSVKKLVPNLMNKNNYVIHYRKLQQCLSLGLKLKKITYFCNENKKVVSKMKDEYGG